MDLLRVFLHAVGHPLGYQHADSRLLDATLGSPTEARCLNCGGMNARCWQHLPRPVK